MQSMSSPAPIPKVSMSGGSIPAMALVDKRRSTGDSQRLSKKASVAASIVTAGESMMLPSAATMRGRSQSWMLRAHNVYKRTEVGGV